MVCLPPASPLPSPHPLLSRRPGNATAARPASAAAALRVEICGDARDLAALADDWQALWARDPAADLFGRPDWFGLWWRHFGAARGPRTLALCRGEAVDEVTALSPLRLHVLSVRDADGTLRAVLPLLRLHGVCDGHGARLLTSPLNSHAPRSALVAAGFDDGVADALADALCADRRWDRLLLGGLPQHDGRAERLAAALRQRGLHGALGAGWQQCGMTVAGDWAAQLASRSHNFRRQQRRNEAALRRHGEPSLQRLDGEAAAGAGFDAFVAIDRLSWKAERGEALALAAPPVQAFYADLVRHFAGQRQATVWLARVGTQPIAALIGLEDGRALYTLKTSFDQRLAEDGASPGQWLLEQVLAQAWQSGAPRIDFLSQHAMVRRWSAETMTFVYGDFHRAGSWRPAVAPVLPGLGSLRAWLARATRRDPPTDPTTPTTPCENGAPR